MKYEYSYIRGKIEHVTYKGYCYFRARKPHLWLLLSATMILCLLIQLSGVNLTKRRMKISGKFQKYVCIKTDTPQFSASVVLKYRALMGREEFYTTSLTGLITARMLQEAIKQKYSACALQLRFQN